jgi:hypothetical protein
MSKVWKIEELEPSSKLVLLAICDNANDEGVCYPSIDKIVSKTSLSRPTVIKNITKLVETNHLLKYQRATKKGGRYSSVYLVFPIETFDNLDPEYAEKFSQSKTVLPCSQSKVTLPENGSQSKTTLPEPSLTLFNHHLFIELSNQEKDLYLEYIALRKQMKLITTMSTHNSLLKKYFEFGRNIVVIQNAIDSNWKDFYQPKPTYQPKQSKLDTSMETYYSLHPEQRPQTNFIEGEIA